MWKITLLPKCWLSFWEIWCGFLLRSHFVIRGFSPWTASGFYPWGNVECPRERVAEWLCGWRHGNSFPMTQSAQSLRQMRSIPHCSKAVFYVFVFYSIDDSATKHNLSPQIFHWSQFAPQKNGRHILLCTRLWNRTLSLYTICMCRWCLNEFIIYRGNMYIIPLKLWRHICVAPFFCLFLWEEQMGDIPVKSQKRAVQKIYER